MDTLRITGAVAGMILLVLLYPRIDNFGSAALYTATWVTFLHVCIGEYVFVRYLQARSHIHNVLDFLATIFITGGMLSFTSPALWCAFFSGLFALAVAKYALIERNCHSEHILRYTQEKIRWELPVVIGLAVLSVILDQLPTHAFPSHIMQILILFTSVGFAIWMILIRHIYQRVGRTHDKTKS
jgi:hypothetical protein